MAKEKTTPETDMATELLLKEADEALRQEKLEALWQEWGKTIIGVALMLVFGTMLGVGWKNWRTGVHEASTLALVTTQPEGLTDTHKGIADLLAANDLITEDMDEGTKNTLRLLMEDIEDSGLPTEWSVIATWVKFRIEAETATETAQKYAIADAIAKASRRDDNPYAPLMLAEAASLYGENGDAQRALDLLREAQEMPITAQAQAVAEILSKLIHLYTTDLSLSAGE